jgi:hypothetical protein
MTKISITTDPDTNNHVRYDYNVENIFVSFPSKQKSLTFVNGTASERTIAAGTLVGITTADQTIGQPVESDASDGSEIPFGIVLYDIVIAAGAAVEAEGLVGWNGSIYEDKIVLEKSGDTLDTVITQMGQSIRHAILNSNAKMELIPEAEDVSGYKDEQV